jgi:hypothetical protein
MIKLVCDYYTKYIYMHLANDVKLPLSHIPALFFPRFFSFSLPLRQSLT